MLIERLEPFDRGFFAGIVGWCDESGDGEWAIAIRCGTVNEMVVRLFAGAGIVEASDPRAEWAETEAKLATMLRAFGVERGIAAMSVDFTPWPEDFARRYREKGYWRGEPLTALLAKRLEIAPDATAIICGERRFSYAELDAWSTTPRHRLLAPGPARRRHGARATSECRRILRGVLRSAENRRRARSMRCSAIIASS